MARALRRVFVAAAALSISTACASGDDEGTPSRTVTGTLPTLPTVTVPEESHTEQAETAAETEADPRWATAPPSRGP